MLLTFSCAAPISKAASKKPVFLSWNKSLGMHCPCFSPDAATMQRHVSISCTIDSCSSEDRVSKTAISNLSRVFNHIFQSARQRAHSVKYVTVSERLYERRCRRRRGWSVVKGRSDIYTRPLPLLHSVGCYMVSWWNTETLNIHALLFLPFLSRSLSFYLPLYLSQPLCAHLVRFLFFPPSPSFPFLFYIIPFRFLASSSLSPFFFAIPPIVRSCPFVSASGIAFSFTAGWG